MRTISNTLAMAAMLAAGALIPASATAKEEGKPGPIAVYGNIQTFEIAPVLLAAKTFYPDVATVKMGGIPNLVGEPIIAGFGEEGVADVATHAETQALRYSVKHPNLRIILQVTEGQYRIVARKSAGIATVADLKGKRVASIPQTSSGYFFHKMLAQAGLSYDDIEVVRTPGPLSEMTKALAERRVDAVIIWEPESENSARALGNDLIEFSGDGVYAEQFNLNSTAENLADPIKRKKIVRFVRAVIDAAAALRKDPAAAQALVVERGGHSVEEVQTAWKHHAFNADYPADLLDIMTEEEQWLAERDKRPARSRAQLARLIDRSVYEEALALEPTT
ncbi:MULTISPECIES: ABC transporter substrate-binding protein [Sphingobium]|uniref:ABC transporter substrate-binding protein n=1 Tax=Sphingobium TaxID=165695 RepID=UPI0017D6A1C5|nr:MULTISPECIES: ABC transporter substrate-binding protein [Sphingobium]MCW2362531.1 NitT/TauT family transport system substrate-binding protein [Sphingobium sp. B10D3B]MCW2400789.1 NitT/TauT family transport system substrate-binding protein [Sphingobium sp. B10D7B]MCW2407768.1 NitT/TauT family transport system substrate-binding protein [Sphingobium xanthum]